MIPRFSLLFCFFLMGALLALPARAQEAGGQGSVDTNTEAFEPPDLPTPNVYRTGSGRPGANYWQQEADYEIAVTLDPDTHRITGTETITYTNNSPQALEYLWLQVEQNLFATESRGALITSLEERFSGAFEDGGFDITNVRLVRNGETVESDPLVRGTRMRIALEEPLEAEGGRLQINLDFAFTVPPYGADRMGRFEGAQGTVYELAQWYPRMYVFDDVSGWNVMPYLGQGEFYLEYGAFEVNITVPNEMIVAATGELMNPEEVLTQEQRERLARTRQSSETVTILGSDEVGEPSSRPQGNDMLTWRFRAENVRDFAWAASSAFIWDAAAADAAGNDVLAQSFYPQEGIGEGSEVGWEESTQMVQHSIEFYSDFLYPYPYPVAINVAGVVGGMEYPQIVFCSVDARGQGLFGVTDHEFGHEWFPMIVGSDEREHVWMDEGLNTFINQYSMAAFYDLPSEQVLRGLMAFVSRRMDDYAVDQPIMTFSDRIQAFGFLGYRKPGAGLALLRDYILTPEVFDSAFHEYIDRWAYKHPQPADFFRTIEDVSGENLDWFWRGWFYTTDNVNPALAEVTVENDTTRIVVAHRGGMVMPLELAVTFENGETEHVRVPVEAFFTGDEHTVVFPATAERIVLGPTGLVPDVDPADGVWTSGEGLQAAPIPALPGR